MCDMGRKGQREGAGPAGNVEGVSRIRGREMRQGQGEKLSSLGASRGERKFSELFGRAREAVADLPGVRI